MNKWEEKDNDNLLFSSLFTFAFCLLPSSFRTFAFLNRQIMESTRQKKVGRLIQKELAEIFRIETRNMFGGNMITVTVVRMSPDLMLAKVYFSVFPSEKQDEVIKMVNKTSGEIRYYLGKRIGKQVKGIPELAFFIDDSLDYAERIENLLNS